MKDFDLIFEILENIIINQNQPPLNPSSLPLLLHSPSLSPNHFIIPVHSSPSSAPPPPSSLSPSALPPSSFFASAPHSPPSLSTLPTSSTPSFIIEILSCLEALAKRFVSQALAKKIIVDYFGIVRGVIEKIEEVKDEKGIQYFLNFICFLTIDCEDREIEVKSNVREEEGR